MRSCRNCCFQLLPHTQSVLSKQLETSADVVNLHVSGDGVDV